MTAEDVGLMTAYLKERGITVDEELKTSQEFVDYLVRNGRHDIAEDFRKTLKEYRQERKLILLEGIVSSILYTLY